MALDQQSNWDIAMADNLRRLTEKPKASSPTRAVMSIRTNTRPPVHLPDELILLILDHIPQEQKTYASCCLLSRQWHEATLPFLYARPQLYGRGFELFARTVCPSINLHVRRSPLSSLIKHLDLSRLVHQGSKSMTARLLGRTKNNLEVFRAPQASFAINCLPALAKCSQLQHLDLALVSESPPLPDLLKAISHLERLHVLKLPRSIGYGTMTVANVRWPPNLKSLALSGGVDNHILRGEVPQTLEDLIIEHCPQLSSVHLTWFLAEFIRPLPRFESITIAHMPKFDGRAMDDLLFILPQVQRVSVSIDHITQDFFSGGNTELWSSIIGRLTSPREAPSVHMMHEHLHTILITSRGSSSPAGKISPLEVLDAMDEEHLPALRAVQIPKNMQWAAPTEGETNVLSSELQERGQTDKDDRTGIFASMSEEDYRRTDPDAIAGVWIYDE